MSYQIDFATAAEEQSLRDIFLANDMPVVGDIEDHVIIRDKSGIYGGGFLYQLDVDLFHLLTIVVQGHGRRRGVGSELLQAMLKNPWRFCRDARGERVSNYRVTTVSRGTSRGFYQKNGLIDCVFEELTEPFDQQCQECPDHAACCPKAMVYQAE